MKAFYLLLFVLTIGAGNALSQSKIAVVDMQKALDTLPSRKAMLSEIAQVEMLGIQELSDMDSVLNAMLLDYQKHPEIDPIVRIQKEDKIRKLQIVMQQREIDIDTIITALSRECDLKSRKLVNDQIAIIAKEMKLNGVIDLANFIYSDQMPDITDRVITEILK